MGEDSKNKTIFTIEEYERFYRLQNAFYSFCLQNDDCEEMADDMNECFERQIAPFDPYKTFSWKKLYNAEIRRGMDETVFTGGKKLQEQATLLDSLELHQYASDGRSVAATGIELWLTDDFDFFTTCYAEVVERDNSGDRVLAMRYREESRKDFYDYVGEFRSEDLFEVMREKIEYEERSEGAPAVGEEECIVTG